MARTNAVWGIDIGQCALKALRCMPAADGQSVEVDRYDYIEYPKLLSQADADPDDLVKEALETFLSRNELRGDRVAISVPGQAGLSRFFKPPPVDAKTLPDIVKYEVKQQIPFPIEDVIWDWQQLGGTVVDGRTMDAEVGLFAMKREAVFRALQPFDDAEIEVDYIQLSPLAIFNVVCFDILDEIPELEDVDPENPPESMVVMSMGTDTTDLIITNGIKLWLRNIPIGGNHFTKQLSREMKLTHAKAEHLKRNARQAEDPQSVFQAMRPVFSDLVNEVQRSLTFFESMDKTAQISKLALLGNAAKLPGLRQYLSKQLEITIAKISEFESMQGDEVTGQQSFIENQLSFAPAYGLCLQGLRKAQVATNLLPNEIITERIIRAKKPWILASVSFIMFGLLLGYFFKEQAFNVVREETQVNGKSWKEAEGEADRVSKDSSTKKKKDDDLKAELAKLNRVSFELTSSFETRTSWLEVLSAIYQALPQDERFKTDTVDPAEFKFKDRNEIYIESIETKFFKEIEKWFTVNKPRYDEQFNRSTESNDAGDVAETKEKAKEAGAGLEEEVKGPGWVIEIAGYHFHNSETAVMARNSGRTYLINNFLKNFFTDIEFPGPENAKVGGGKYKFEDFGVFIPTIVTNRDPIVEELSYSEDDDANARADNAQVERVKKYDFVIQMAWVPRSPAERYAAKMKREEEQAKKEEAARAAAER
ncbi:MAG: type IV pilus assembly protein PilM, partial [Planctomycetota bacterium]